jgi:hypothetical protein
MKKIVVNTLKAFDLPPSSPPQNGFRLINISEIARKAPRQKMVTEKAREPGFTLNLVPLAAW